MHAIPSTLNLDRIVGQEINQICIGTWDVQFHFTENSCISGSGNIFMRLHATAIPLFTDEGWGNTSKISELLGREIVGWSIESSYALTISLIEDISIGFISEDSPYEDFVLSPDSISW